MSFVQIRHPDIAGTATCPESALEHWRRAGWEQVSASEAAVTNDVQLVEHEPGSALVEDHFDEQLQSK